LGPIFATTAAVIAGCPAPPVPGLLIRTAQLFFGIYMGIVITLESLRRLGKVLPYAVGGAVLLVAFTYLIAFGITAVTPPICSALFWARRPGARRDGRRRPGAWCRCNFRCGLSALQGV